MSNFLIWETVRKSDSRAIKKSVGTFSSDPLNLSNLHSFSSTSVAQGKALGISQKGGKTLLTVKVAGGEKTPSKSKLVINLKVSFTPHRPPAYINLWVSSQGSHNNYPLPMPPSLAI